MPEESHRPPSSQWFEPGRPFPSPNRTRHWNILQLARVTHAPQQQAAAAHVSSPDEFGREDQSLTESLEERVHVFSGRYAAEEYQTRALAQHFMQGIYVTPERSSIPLVRTSEIHLRKGAQIAACHMLVWSHQPSVRRNNECLWRVRWGSCKRTRVSHLSAKVEPTQEAENLTQWRTGISPQARRERKIRARVQKHLSATPVAARW